MNNIKKVTVLYFASLADKAQKGSETLTIEPDTTLTELYQKLQDSYQFRQQESDLRVAINDEFADWNVAINEGD
ncbi:MoaD/ThiS family protein, partial [Psychrobacter sp.]|uniref:MoaD/ThiS family protein n=1 Tax=Psychrobacter sp. TaxID=56811 RepID=UPI0026007086